MSFLADIAMSVPGILMGLTCHELGHAITATWFGDDTPRAQGRVNLNPLAHLDLWGTLLIFTVGFGWAKPVQVNVNRLRPRVWGDIAVSLAGVTMNFLLALIFGIFFAMGTNGFYVGYHNPVLNEVLFRVVWINMGLIAFNLLPLPPLDGFRVVQYLFPPSMGHVVDLFYRFSPLLLFLVFFRGNVLSAVLSPLMSGIFGVISTIVGWIV